MNQEDFDELMAGMFGCSDDDIFDEIPGSDDADGEKSDADFLAETLIELLGGASGSGSGKGLEGIMEGLLGRINAMEDDMFDESNTLDTEGVTGIGKLHQMLEEAGIPHLYGLKNYRGTIRYYGLIPVHRVDLDSEEKNWAFEATQTGSSDGSCSIKFVKPGENRPGFVSPEQAFEDIQKFHKMITGG